MTRARLLGGCRAFLVLAALGIGMVAYGQLPERDVILLDGTWRSAVTPADVDAPPADGWREFNIPQHLSLDPTGGSKCAWFAREIDAPSDLTGKRVFVDLRIARFEPDVFIDGKLAGHGSDGWSPSVIDITSFLSPGAKHTLTVRVHDYGVYLPKGFVKTDSGENSLRGKVLAPVGGYKTNTGITDHVRLRITADRFIDSDTLQIVTSTRKSTITVAGSVRYARPGSTMQVEVLDGDERLLTPAPVSIGPDGAFTLTAAFPNARQWSPEDPFLHTLRLMVIEGGKPVDVCTTRFGFKEVWTQGPDFYINGVKRRLLGSATWPLMEYERPEVIRAKVANIRAAGTLVFRTHIGPWQEAWIEAADELGLLMVPEAAVYTDGSGFYAYDDERFWENYRRHIKGMILRDRNRASVALWSLGNEILFMGNASRATDLPRKLGDLARYARTVDPYRPYTFEADLDPDGAYDIIGLHYPHEMPAQRNYPNTADWLDRRKDTEAGGGMLGQQGAEGFLWKRDKPLYIGEFLWCPQGDYSVGTIWYGDEAFTNRSAFNVHARNMGWFEQSIAYRRAGVTGICPWTVFGFGGVAKPTDEQYRFQQQYYRPQAAYFRTQGYRYFAGEKAIISFDVFNDSSHTAEYELSLRASSLSIAPVKLTLAPAEYRRVDVPVALPDAAATLELPVEAVLTDAGKEVDRQQRLLRVFPRRSLSTSNGQRLIILDPSSRWPKSVAALPADIRPASDVVLLAHNVIPPPSTTPIIGAPVADLAPLRRFLLAGGRAVILEQGDLGPLGLGLSLSENPSTMTFPFRPDHPLMKGLQKDDLKYWAPDNFVTHYEILRPTSGGATAIAVSGGESWLASGPVTEVGIGAGRAVVIQALAGQKFETEPAARQLIQNAIDHLAGQRRSAQPARLLASDPDFEKALKSLRVTLAADSNLLILHGGPSPDRLASLRSTVEAALKSGGTLYWHAPTPEAFTALRDVLSASSLCVRLGEAGITLRDRTEPLLDGVSREDLTATSEPSGWTRQITPLPLASLGHLASDSALAFTPVDLSAATLREASLKDGVLRFARRGRASFNVTAPSDGVYVLRAFVDTTGKQKNTPAFNLDVDSVLATCFQLAPSTQGHIEWQVALRKGENKVGFDLVNAEEWSDSHDIKLSAFELSTSPALPAELKVLTVPAALTTWVTPAGGRVVIDQVNWTASWPGPSKPRRYASAFLSNLGVAFDPPPLPRRSTSIPLSAFNLIGESPYFSRSRERIAPNSNCVLEARVECQRAGQYTLTLRGSGTPAAGVFPHVILQVNGKQVTELNVASTGTENFTSAPFALPAGNLTLRLIYDNDQLIGKEDRNLVIRQVSFDDAP
jgi:hypothetical protein